MPDPGKHESQDLGDYEVLDGSDTLDGNPGDDPLDRGVAAPDRWSAGLRYALQGEEDSESLDELLAEEEPDDTDDPDADSWDENATDEDVGQARCGTTTPTPGPAAWWPAMRTPTTSATRCLDWDDEAVARDTGIDGGGATAEEAAVHVIDDDEDEDE